MKRLILVLMLLSCINSKNIAQIAATAILALLLAPAAHADATPIWPVERTMRFAAYQAAHPHAWREIARIRKRTAAMIAATPPRRAAPRATTR